MGVVDTYLARRVADLELRRNGALALLNLGHVPAARHVLAGGSGYWPTIRQVRRMSRRTPLWWVALDEDTMCWLRMRMQIPNPRRTPLAVSMAG